MPDTPAPAQITDEDIAQVKALREKVHAKFLKAGVDPPPDSDATDEEKEAWFKKNTPEHYEAYQDARRICQAFLDSKIQHTLDLEKGMEKDFARALRAMLEHYGAKNGIVSLDLGADEKGALMGCTFAMGKVDKITGILEYLCKTVLRQAFPGVRIRVKVDRQKLF